MRLLNSPLTGFIALWLFAAVIHGMPTPREDERWYGWAYSSLQFMGANLAQMKQAKLPGGDGNGRKEG